MRWVWRGREWTYAEMDTRVDGVAHYLASAGLGCHTERDALAGHESGQDHLGLYLRNGNEYLEAMIAGYRARVAPFNVSYRYVEDELLYLLNDSRAKALVYHAEFAPRVAAIRERLPHLQVLVQVADESGNDLLPGAVDYESITTTPAPAAGMPTPTRRRTCTCSTPAEPPACPRACCGASTISSSRRWAGNRSAATPRTAPTPISPRRLSRRPGRCRC